MLYLILVNANMALEGHFHVQEPAAGGAQREAKKARRSSGLREILSLALESGAAAGASAVPVTWDGSADNRRAPLPPCYVLVCCGCCARCHLFAFCLDFLAVLSIV